MTDSHEGRCRRTGVDTMEDRLCADGRMAIDTDRCRRRIEATWFHRRQNVQRFESEPSGGIGCVPMEEVDGRSSIDQQETTRVVMEERRIRESVPDRKEAIGYDEWMPKGLKNGSEDRLLHANGWNVSTDAIDTEEVKTDPAVRGSS